MPDPDRILRIVQRAVQLFRDTPGRNGRFVDLQGTTEVVVTGDLHGNLGNFRLIISRANLRENPTRHLVVQELIHGHYDYPTGGERSHQVLDLLCALKCELPKQVHMLLGNHELAQLTGNKISKGDRELLESFTRGVRTAYNVKADAIYATYRELFTVLPLAIRTPNRVFLSHSLPTKTRLATFDPKTLEQDSHSDKELMAGGSVHSLVWGRDTRLETAEAFLKMVDADLLITGHIPNDTGFEVPNERQIILDTMRDPAAICVFPTDRPLTHAELVKCVEMI